LKYKRGRLTTSQQQWLDDLEEQGWITGVCRNVRDVVKMLESVGYINMGNTHKTPLEEEL